MTLKENMKSAYALRKEKESIEKQIEELKARITEIETQLETHNSEIMASLKEQNMFEFECGGVFANLFKKENIGYTSDTDVIKFLKDKGLTQFIKVKTTESLDKTPLKKELKTNEQLSKDLEQFIKTSITEWVVVTDKLNHDKMIEHINENSK